MYNISKYFNTYDLRSLSDKVNQMKQAKLKELNDIKRNENNIEIISENIIKPEKKILITGASGNLATKLMQFWRSKYELTLIDSRNPTKMINYILNKSKLSHAWLKLDILNDVDNLSKLMIDNDVIIHFACQNTVPNKHDINDMTSSIDINNHVMLTFNNICNENTYIKHGKTKVCHLNISLYIPILSVVICDLGILN